MASFTHLFRKENIYILIHTELILRLFQTQFFCISFLLYDSRGWMLFWSSAIQCQRKEQSLKSLQKRRRALKSANTEKVILMVDFFFQKFCCILQVGNQHIQSSYSGFSYSIKNTDYSPTFILPLNSSRESVCVKLHISETV